MNINRTTFFAYARRAPFGGRLTTGQVEGMETILSTFFALFYRDERWLAYILATAFHETGGTMQPIREAFGKSDADTGDGIRFASASPSLGSSHSCTGNVCIANTGTGIVSEANTDRIAYVGNVSVANGAQYGTLGTNHATAGNI